MPKILVEFHGSPPTRATNRKNWRFRPTTNISLYRGNVTR